MKSSLARLVEVLALVFMMGTLAVFLPELLPGSPRHNTAKSTCASNLQQIYQAMRLYQDDHGSYPESLYGFVDATTGREWPGLYPTYIRDRSSFHCPRAPFDTDDRRRVLGRHPTIGFSRFPARLYPIWDSYDGQLEPANAKGAYQVRYVKKWSAAANRRQLGEPNAADDTVVTWCGYHRNYPWGQLRPEGSLDLVLFLDGHVKTVPTSRMFPTAVGGRIPPEHSYRVPRD